MSRFSDQPEALADLLRTMAKRVRKVDLTVIEEIRQLWTQVVDPALAGVCHPEFVKNRVLVVSVPSGAFAQQIKLDQESILHGLASLNDRAPTSIKTVQKA
jgi:predicted nucleic acid-binding Zn ribbon protein